MLGSNQFIPGFEAQCIGQTVGEDFDVVVSFPEDYQAENLAGKEATFACKSLKELKVKKVPEIGPELADATGEADLDALKAKVKAGIEDRQNEGSLAETREKLRALVGQQYDFDVPDSLTQSSFDDKKNEIDRAVREGESMEKAEADFESKRDETLEDVKSSMRAMFVLDELG